MTYQATASSASVLVPRQVMNFFYIIVPASIMFMSNALKNGDG